MVLEFDDLTAIYPEHLCLELSEQQKEDAWMVSHQDSYSCEVARWNAYLNYLSLDTFLTYLKEDSDFQDSSKISVQFDDLPSIWEFVNGTAVTVGETKLVLIPSDKSNISHFCIPQEWVDIRNWVARYYLAVQVNLDEGWLRIWGCASHQQIRERAFFDSTDKVYCLNAEELIADINVMWVARDFVPWQQLELQPLPHLSTMYLEQLLSKNARITSYYSDLDIAFEEWAALLSSDSLRKHLYQQRLKNSQIQKFLDSEIVENNLCQWLENIFTKGWYTLDTLLNQQGRSLTVQFRKDMALNEIAIKGAKLIDLGMELENSEFVLLVGISPKIDDKYNVRVQVHPVRGDLYLPSQVKLMLLSSSGAFLQEAVSRNYDHYIQLKRFKSLAGTNFTIQVVYGNVTIKEDFVLKPVISE
jgi:Protein of unknown function (DUF1822)